MIVPAASADPPHRPRPPVRQRINVRVYDGYRSGIVFHRFSSTTPREKNPCFPYSCGGIGEPQTNPKPRTEDEKPACYYDQNDVLFFEKEGSNCSYMLPASKNEARVEKRRQEWLRKQKASKDSPK